MLASITSALVFCFYIGVILCIGVIAFRRTNDSSDYFLGGRKLSPGVAAISAGASDMSGWTLLGLPGFAYIAGLEALWIAIGLVLGVAASWIFVAKKLRLASEKLGNAITIPMFLHARFECQKPWLKIISSLSILVFFLFYVGSGLIAGGKLFNEVFGVDYELAVYTSVVLILIYTIFGGFLAVSWTDVFQAILMLIALVCVPIMTVYTIGGTDIFHERVINKNINLFNMFTDVNGASLTFFAIVSYLGWGLGYFGQPHVLSRFMAIKSSESVPIASKYGVIWALCCYTLAILIGLSGISFFTEELMDGEKVFIMLTDLLFHPVIAGLFLAAILAAIMSTIDSQLLVCSASLAEDLYPLIKKEISSHQKLAAGRMTVVLIAVLATLIALEPDSKILDVVSYAWAGLGASLGPVVLFSLYYKKMTEISAILSIFFGGGLVLVWDLFSGGIFSLYSLVPGFIFSSLSIILLSNMFPKKHNSQS